MRREELLNDPEEAFRLGLEGNRAGLWTALPGTVTAVDLDTQTVSVQPAVQARITEPGGASRLADLPLLVDVPIVWPRGGGFALTFPVQPGDEVLVVFAARCIDAWWQSGGSAAPAEDRMHDLSDGFAILGPTSQPRKLGGVDGQKVQLRNEDGSTFVEIGPSGIVAVTATAEIRLKAPIVRIESPAISLNGVAWGTHIHGSTPPPSGPDV